MRRERQWDAERLVRQIMDADHGFRCVPAAFDRRTNGHVLSTRLRYALAGAADLDGGDADARLPPTAEAVMASRGDSATVLRLLAPSATALARRSGDVAFRELRHLYGFDAELVHRRLRWDRPWVRVLVCLAADLTWMPYAHGILLARDQQPGSLATDVRALSATLYLWAVQDHPAVATALGAALVDAHGDRRLPFPAFADLLRRMLTPHLGGSFAADADRHLLDTAIERAAMHISRLLGRDRVPVVVASAIAAVVLDELTDTLGDRLDLTAPDPVAGFERAAASLVRQAVADPTTLDATLATLQRMRDGLAGHAA